MAYAKTEEDIVRAAVVFHMGYEKIHPYNDGNGRTGRLLLNHVLLSNEIAPLVIRAEDKAFYYKCLREHDENSLTNYAAACIKEEFSFINVIANE